MKKLILILLLFPALLKAADIYVAVDGSGDYTTLTAASSALSSGDNLYLRRGDTWNETLIISVSNVSVTAYGTGDNPLISGYQEVTGWTDEGGNIHSKVLTQDDIYLFTWDGNKAVKGKFPDNYTTYITSTDASTTITNTAFDGYDFTGLEIAFKENNWTITVDNITDHTGSTLTFTGETGPKYTDIRTGDGYWVVVQNDSSFLNSDGEWAFKKSENKLYVYSSDAITNHTIAVSSIDYGIYVQADNVTIDGIDIYYTDEFAIRYDNSGMTVSNFDIKYSGSYGISHVAGTPHSNITINDGNIEHCQDGISSYYYTSGATNIDIHDITLDSIGLYPALGVYFTNQTYPIYTGIKVAANTNSDYCTVYNNTLSNIGYNGIGVYEFDHTDIYYNYVDRTNSLLEDGSQIYFYITQADTTRILNGVNIHHNITKNGELANGVYVDGYSNNVNVYNNTTINTEFGAFTNNPRFNTFRNNTFYDCKYGFAAAELSEIGAVSRDNLFSKNIIYTESGTNYFAYLKSDFQGTAIYNLGVIDSNYYFSDDITADLFQIRTNPPWSLADYTFLEWGMETSKDANSTLIEATPAIYYNATMTSTTVLSGYSGNTATGTYSDGIELDAFESVVVLDSTSLTGDILIYDASEADYDTLTTIDDINTWQTSEAGTGDSILFQRGSKYYGKINMVDTQNGRHYNAYGSGERPILSVLDTVDTWTNLSGNVYYNVVGSGLNLKTVVVNNTLVGKARTPNVGSFYEYENESASTITDNELTGNWIGAEALIIKTRSKSERVLITNQSGTTLTFSNYGEDVEPNGVDPRYFLQNHLNCLDQNYEWVYSNDTLYMYFSSTPTAVVEYATDYAVFNLQRADNCSFKNIDIRGSNGFGLRADLQAVNMDIENVNISFCGDTSIVVYGNNATIDNVIVSNSHGGGLFQADGITITNSSFTNIGMVYGQSDDSRYSIPITLAYGDNQTASYNSITNSCYSGIYVWNGGMQTGITINNNIITNTCQLLDKDGGAIYINDAQADLRIHHNLIFGNDAGFGIYLDESASGAQVDSNYVDGMKAGTHIHISGNNDIFDNIFLNSYYSGISYSNSSTGSLGAIANNAFRRNTISSDSLFVKIYTEYGATDVQSMADQDSNYIYSPLTDLGYIDETTNYYIEYTDWTGYGYDTHSDKLSVEPVGYYNATTSPVTVLVNHNGTLSDGTTYTDGITLLAYQSIAVLDSVLNAPISTYMSFPFLEGSGSIVYDVINNRTGTLNDTYTRIVGQRDKKALNFNASGYINLGTQFNGYIDSALTISAWIAPEDTGSYQGIVMHGGPNIDTYALYVWNDNNTIGFKTTGTTNQWTSVQDTNHLWNGGWHLLTVTWDGVYKRIFVDKNLIYSEAATGVIESGIGYNLYIGAGRDEATPTLLYDGDIDNVKIYNYALTYDQIANIYESERIKVRHSGVGEKYIIYNGKILAY